MWGARMRNLQKTEFVRAVQMSSHIQRFLTERASALSEALSTVEVITRELSNASYEWLLKGSYDDTNQAFDKFELFISHIDTRTISLPRDVNIRRLREEIDDATEFNGVHVDLECSSRKCIVIGFGENLESAVNRVKHLMRELRFSTDLRFGSNSDIGYKYSRGSF